METEHFHWGDKILTVSKFKLFARYNYNMTHMLQFLFAGVENIAGKGGKAGTSIFSFSHNVFKRLLVLGR